jgi:hypothetical protein
MHAIYYHPVIANLFEPLWPIIIYKNKNYSIVLSWATFYNLNKIIVWAIQSELWAYVWDLLICPSTSHTIAVVLHGPDFSHLATC